MSRRENGERGKKEQKAVRGGGGYGGKSRGLARAHAPRCGERGFRMDWTFRWTRGRE